MCCCGTESEAETQPSYLPYCTCVIEMAGQPAKKRKMELPPPAHAAVSRLTQHEVALPEGVVLSPGSVHGNRVALAVSAGGRERQLHRWLCCLRHLLYAHHAQL